jgi:hypothetical protein
MRKVLDAASTGLRRPASSMIGAAPDRAVLRFDELAVVS